MVGPRYGQDSEAEEHKGCDHVGRAADPQHRRYETARVQDQYPEYQPQDLLQIRQTLRERLIDGTDEVGEGQQYNREERSPYRPCRQVVRGPRHDYLRGLSCGCVQDSLRGTGTPLHE